MLVKIPALLNRAQLDKIDQMLAHAEFVDGRLTAGKAAVQVKNNLEMKPEAQTMELLGRIVMSTLGHNETFRNAALPYRISDPIVARYQPGMTYGDHVDDPIMGSGARRFRSDVSMTVFLRDADSYQGGELTINTSFGLQQVKLDAGDAVVYPSASIHRVAEVSAGERLVILAWIQSYVKDAARRELLFDLSQARDTLLAGDQRAEVCQQVDRSYVNLLRMWSEV
jgi:PKHD-type hydroxylase